MNYLLLVLASVAVVGIQVLAAGRQPALCLPSYALLAVGAWLGWMAKRSSPVSPRVGRNLAATGVFCAWIALRALTSPDAYLARRDLWLVLAAVLIYLLFALNLTSAKHRSLFVVVLLLLAGADFLVGALQYEKGDNFMPIPFLPRAEYGTRASGFFGCPNHLAGFLEIAFMFGLSMTFWSGWKAWVKILTGYLSLLCVAGIVLTGSRGGYMSAGLGFLAFVCLSLYIIGRQARQSIPILVAFISVVLLVLSWGVKSLVAEGSLVDSHINSAVSLGVTRENCRPYLWHAAMEQFRLNPLPGTGSGTYLYYGRQFRSPQLQSDPLFAHNDYLQLLAEYGVIGAVTFLVFFASHLWTGWRAFRAYISTPDGGTQDHGMAVCLGSLCATIAIGAHSFVDFNLHMPANTLLMAGVFGILANPVETRLLGFTDSPQEGSPYPRLALPVLASWLAFAALTKFPAEYYAEECRYLLSGSGSLESAAAAGQVVTLAQRGLRYDSRNPDLYYELGEGHFSQALLAANPSESQAHYVEAITAYQHARELAPRDVRLWLCEATAYDALQRFGEADLPLARALELDPNSTNVQCALASHLFLQKRFAEAEAEYRKAEKLGSQTALYWLQRIAEMHKAGQLGAATAQPPPDNGDQLQNP